MHSDANQFGKPNRSLTLIIGDMETWVGQGRDVPNIEGYRFIDIANLTPALLRRLAPDVVLSSLVGDNFDAVDIAKKLGQMDFAGAYRVLTQNVPDISLILAEIHGVAPRLDVDVIDLVDIFPDL